MDATEQLVAQPGQDISIPRDDEDRLASWLSEQITHLEMVNGPLVRNISTWWEWHAAKPLEKERNFPFKGASNVVIPLIRTHSDGIAARYNNSMFATEDFLMAKPRNEDTKELLRETVRFLNMAGNGNDFDWFVPLGGVLNEVVPIGGSILSLEYGRKTRDLLVPGEGGRVRKLEKVTMSEGPVLRHTRRENWLWDPHYSISDAPVVANQALLSEADVRMLLPDTPQEKLQKVFQTPSAGGYTAGTRTTRAQLQSTTQDLFNSKLYDIREVRVVVPALRGAGLRFMQDIGKDRLFLPLIITYHPDTQTILRIIAHPYLTPGWTLYEFNYRPDKIGLCKRFEHLQRGATTVINQMFDSNTLANSISLVTTDNKVYQQGFTPARPIKVDQIEDVDVISTAGLKNHTPDIALFNLIMSVAERESGVNDPTLGRETRLGGHPSPASSTAMLLSESRDRDRATLRRFRRTVGRVAEDIVTLYQQFQVQGSGRIERMVGSSDGAKVEEFLFSNDPASLLGTFDIRAISESQNPEAERQRGIFVMQATASFYTQVLQALQVATQAQQQGSTPMVQVALRSIQALQESFSEVLQASEVDNIEQYLLEAARTNNAGAFQQIGTAASEALQGVAASAPGPLVSNTPQGPGGLPIANNEPASPRSQ